jgi:predicted phosphodiesterase
VRIAALSDFHIGIADRMCALGHTPDAFLRFLDHLESTHDRIVLLGDIYQCDHALRTGPMSAARQLEQARARTPWLTQRLERPDYTLIHGNHDAITRVALDAPTAIRFGSDDFSVLLTHGDAHDPIIGTAPRVSATATWVSGRIRSAGLRPVAGWLEGRDVAIKADRFQVPGGPYAQGAASLIAEEGVDVVVFGHTHVPWRTEVPGGILLNTGTCSRGRQMYASIDTDAQTAEIRVE